MSVGIIAAVSPSGVIGLNGKIPWHYSADLKRFKSVTMGSNVIMGRFTWESLPRRPLVGRRNVVVTSRTISGVECYQDVFSALTSCTGRVWFIGGSRIFVEAMEYADVIDLTFVPDRIEDQNAVLFPEIDSSIWEEGQRETNSNDDRLERCVYRRKKVKEK